MMAAGRWLRLTDDASLLTRVPPTCAAAAAFQNRPIMHRWATALRDGALAGSLASVLSTVALARIGRRETGSAFAATDAVSHWLWGDEALQQDQADGRYTLTGFAIHHGASVLWASLYSALHGQRPEAGSPAHAAAGALVTAAAACLVDFRLTPHRFTPGFEHRLSRGGLALVYGSFAAGLFMGSLLIERKRQQQAKRLTAPLRAPGSVGAPRARGLRWRNRPAASARRAPG
jgi:hypothetical protein